MLPFGSQKFILSDDDLKFDCKAVDAFSRDQKIRWKHTDTYNLRGNGIAERMVSMIKRALQKMSRMNMLYWYLRLDQVYTGTVDVQVLTANLRFSEENETSIHPSTKEAREFGLVKL